MKDDKITVIRNDLYASTWAIYLATWPVNGIGRGQHGIVSTVLWDSTFRPIELSMCSAWGTWCAFVPQINMGYGWSLKDVNRTEQCAMLDSSGPKLGWFTWRSQKLNHFNYSQNRYLAQLIWVYDRYFTSYGVKPFLIHPPTIWLNLNYDH